jgi:hypothetical protein
MRAPRGPLPAVSDRAVVTLGIAVTTSLVLSGTQMQARARRAPATEPSVSQEAPSPNREAARRQDRNRTLAPDS